VKEVGQEGIAIKRQEALEGPLLAVSRQAQVTCRLLRARSRLYAWIRNGI